jgi:hypothetical protein
MLLALRPDLYNTAMSRKSQPETETGLADNKPLQAPAGAGAPLPATVQAKMEQLFATDLSAVRIHQGPEASAIGALAYTHDSDIHFAPGQYDPDSQRGHELLGHELTHVVQQAQGRAPATTQAKGIALNTDTALEQEADTMGRLAAEASSVKGGHMDAPRARPRAASASVVQRFIDPDTQTTIEVDQIASLDLETVTRYLQHLKDETLKVNDEELNALTDRYVALLGVADRACSRDPELAWPEAGPGSKECVQEELSSPPPDAPAADIGEIIDLEQIASLDLASLAATYPSLFSEGFSQELPEPASQLDFLQLFRAETNEVSHDATFLVGRGMDPTSKHRQVESTSNPPAAFAKPNKPKAKKQRLRISDPKASSESESESRSPSKLSSDSESKLDLEARSNSEQSHPTGIATTVAYAELDPTIKNGYYGATFAHTLISSSGDTKDLEGIEIHEVVTIGRNDLGDMRPLDLAGSTLDESGVIEDTIGTSADSIHTAVPNLKELPGIYETPQQLYWRNLKNTDDPERLAWKKFADVKITVEVDIADEDKSSEKDDSRDKDEDGNDSRDEDSGGEDDNRDEDDSRDEGSGATLVVRTTDNGVSVSQRYLEDPH